MPIKNMNRVPGQRDDIAFFYGKAGSFVGYLIGEFGPTRMTVLLTELNSGKNPSAAIGLAYGFELDSLDAAWTCGQVWRGCAGSGSSDPGRPGRSRWHRR